MDSYSVPIQFVYLKVDGESGGLPGAAAEPLLQAAAAGQDNTPQSSGLQVRVPNGVFYKKV